MNEQRLVNKRENKDGNGKNQKSQKVVSQKFFKNQSTFSDIGQGKKNRRHK